MGYIINFQIILYLKRQSSFVKKRTTYSLTDKDVLENNLLSFDDVHGWFSNFFKNTSLDNFINTKEIKDTISKVDIKVGRITKSGDGSYRTY